VASGDINERDIVMRRKHGRRVAAAMARAGAASVRNGELGLAAGNVIARRVALGVAAMGNPAAADHAEFARMVPEKVEAFSAAGGILVQKSAAIGRQVARYTVSEAGLASQAAIGMAACRSPVDLFNAQSRYLAGAAGRLFALGFRLGTMGLAIGGAAMVPVHRAATANAKRLG
jgi:hypothetical protein